MTPFIIGFVIVSVVLAAIVRGARRMPARVH
jgi:hypothetical protein